HGAGGAGQEEPDRVTARPAELEHRLAGQRRQVLVLPEAGGAPPDPEGPGIRERGAVLGRDRRVRRRVVQPEGPGRPPPAGHRVPGTALDPDALIQREGRDATSLLAPNTRRGHARDPPSCPNTGTTVRGGRRPPPARTR